MAGLQSTRDPVCPQTQGWRYHSRGITGIITGITTQAGEDMYRDMVLSEKGA